MKIKHLSIVLLFIFIIGIFSSCGKKLNAEEIRKYSDGTTENILTAINNDDYAVYTKDFSPEMKKAIPEDTFKEQNKIIKGKIGTYESKKFAKAETKDEYIRTFYIAKFSDEPKDVTVLVVFKADDPDHKVQGIFLSSPKLAK